MEQIDPSFDPNSLAGAEDMVAQLVGSTYREFAELNKMVDPNTALGRSTSLDQFKKVAETALAPVLQVQQRSPVPALAPASIPRSTGVGQAIPVPVIAVSPTNNIVVAAPQSNENQLEFDFDDSATAKNIKATVERTELAVIRLEKLVKRLIEQKDLK